MKISAEESLFLRSTQMPPGRPSKSRSWIIFEEIIRRLLIMAGYREILMPAVGIRMGGAGHEFLGRGGWHQIDVPLRWPHQVPLSQPIVSLVEAKFRKKVMGLNVIREALAVQLDISQNSFTATGRFDDVTSRQHIHYQSAVASISGFSEDAVRFAYAHQIYLLDYSPFPFLRPFYRYLERINGSVRYEDQNRFRSRIREDLGQGLAVDLPRPEDSIRASIFGLLGDNYPVHFFSPTHTNGELVEFDGKNCQIHYRQNLWSISYRDQLILQFSLPIILGHLLLERGDGWRARADMKAEFMDRISLLLSTEDEARTIVLRLDHDWLQRYVREREREP